MSIEILASYYFLVLKGFFVDLSEARSAHVTTAYSYHCWLVLIGHGFANNNRGFCRKQLLHTESTQYFTFPPPLKNDEDSIILSVSIHTDPLTTVVR